MSDLTKAPTPKKPNLLRMELWPDTKPQDAHKPVYAVVDGKRCLFFYPIPGLAEIVKAALDRPTCYVRSLTITEDGVQDD